MSAGPFSSSEVQVWRVQRKIAGWAARLLVGFMVLPVVAATLLAGMTLLFGESHGAATALLFGWLGAWLGGAPLSLLTAYLASLRTKQEVTALQVIEGDLRLEGPRPSTIPARDIEGAITVATGYQAGEAEIALKSGDVLHVRAGEEESSAAEARNLVQALGFGGKQRRTMVPLGGTRTPLWRALWAVFAGTVATSLSTCLSFAALGGSSRATDVALLLMAIVFTGVTLAAAKLTGPRRLVVGADGVEIEGPFRKRFFPRKEIFGVEKIRDHVSILLRGRGDDVREVKLPVESFDRGEAVLRHIRGALESETEEVGAAAAVLARGGDSIAAWRERLRKLVAPAEGYRNRTVPVDTLLKTAGDVDAAAELRIGAALAIAQSGDEDARRRLRIATEAIANEPVRLALEAAAESEAEDEAIAEAFARAETESMAKGRPRGGSSF